MRSLPKMLAALLFAVWLPTAAAHDFWLEPNSYQVAPGTELQIRVLVGSAKAELKEIGRRSKRIVQFFILAPRLRRPVPGEENKMPAGRVTVTERGLHLIAYESDYTYLELEAKRFESYLLHEGLDHVSIDRRIRGEGDAPGRESYSRSAKTLVRVGKSDVGFDRVAGLPVEIVAESSPYAPSGCVKLRLESAGAPLPQTTVRLVNIATRAEILRKKTDASGRACLEVPGPGRWMFAAIYMRRAKAPVKGDWQSTWATLAWERRK